ncbi:molybdopterin-dependent oxidoreductase [Sanguibacter sp. 25GB23B1]|uniref:molybdopterin-dependent oxidoreductase n=1 Tax=unclassified Sanguibacter TaxID=2645534 RepID=UPI0032AF17E4
MPREESFSSRLRGPAVASRVGLWLGICFVVAFVTGLYSHVSQEPAPWIALPTRPSWTYQVSQGLHVISGTAAVPLLLVKLWSVFPKLFARPPWKPRRELVLHALERASVGVLVAAAIFQLATGLANSAQWYPWHFGFRSTHYAVGWIAVGAILVHVAVKLPMIRRALGSDVDAGPDGAADTTEDLGKSTGGLSRRGLLRTTWVASALVVLGSAGSTVPFLRQISVFGVRSGDGPGGIPINRTAAAARVTETAVADDFSLAVVHGEREVRLARDQIAGMVQHSAVLPIACVEGWSASGEWTGVRVKDLVALVGAPLGAAVLVTSLQERGAYRESRLPGNFVADDDTLLALQLGGEPLSLDHGYPCRIIAPNRPGVLQTKWVSRLEVET